LKILNAPINTHLPNYFPFPTSGKGVLLNFDGVGAGWHQTVRLSCIVIFGMKRFGSDIGKIVWYWVGTVWYCWFLEDTVL